MAHQARMASHQKKSQRRVQVGLKPWQAAPITIDISEQHGRIQVGRQGQTETQAGVSKGRLYCVSNAPENVQCLR